MKTKKITIAAILLVFVLVIVGYVTPTLFANDGTADYVGIEQKYAKAAIEDTRQALASPSVYRIYTTNLRVIQLSATGNELCPYEATVQGYTFFGIKNESLKREVQPGCGNRPFTK